MLIELTGADGAKLLVNTSHVVRVCRQAGGVCEVWLVSNERIPVREDTSEIIKAARLAGA